MTVTSKLINMLVQMGVFEQHATQIVELAKPELNKVVNDYTITFNAPSQSYPDVCYNLWIELIKPTALKWIDENLPQAWYRQMFVTEFN